MTRTDCMLGIGLVCLSLSPAAGAATWLIRLQGEQFNQSAPFPNHRIAVTPDGGFAIAKDSPGFLMKLDPSGAIQWQHRFDTVIATAVAVARDGRILMTGRGTDRNVARSVNLLSVIDAAGSLLSQQAYGCTGNSLYSIFNDVHQTSDDGFILGGVTDCGGTTEDVWLVKLDAALAIQWQMAYEVALTAGPNRETDVRVMQKADGSYFVVANTGVLDPSVSTVTPLVLHVSATGTVLKADVYGCTSLFGPCYSYLVNGADLLAGGELVIAGHPPFTALLDPGGTLRWQRSYQGTANFLAGVSATADGGFVLTGSSVPITGFDQDAFLAKLDASGAVLVRKAYGDGPNQDAGDAVLPTADGGYMMTAYAAPSFDMFAVRADPAMRIDAACGLEHDTVDLTEWTLFQLSAPRTPTVTPRTTNLDVVPDLLAQNALVFMATSECGTAGACATTAAAVAGVKAVKTGTSVGMSWQPDPSAAGYNVWYVTDKRDTDRARLPGLPPTTGVAGCSEPSPATGTTCTDGGAITRGAPGLFHYQVRVSCDATTEGP